VNTSSKEKKEEEKRSARAITRTKIMKLMMMVKIRSS
jgi:hypothetical protein